MADASKVLRSATSSASYNVVLQVLFRLSTFALNAFVLRYVSKTVLGLANVRLMLIYTSVLFVAREPFRKACLDQRPEEARQANNLAWMCVAAGVATSILLGGVWLYLLEQPTGAAEAASYPLAVALYLLAAVLELCCEPLWVHAQMKLFVRLKVILEGLAITARALVLVILVTYDGSWSVFGFSLDNKLLAFAYSQVAYGLVLCLGYFGYFGFATPLSVEKGAEEADWLSMRLVKLTQSFFSQSLLKQLLTEGERYLMTFFAVLKFDEQGVYDVVNNLGSLAARFLFMPVEESFYIFFSRILSRDGDDATPDADLAVAAGVLSVLLKAMGLVGLTVLSFGQAYSFLLLDLYGGSTLSAHPGPFLLRCYCVYVLFLALNGISECFMMASADRKTLDRFNRYMVGFSVVFLLASWALVSLIGSGGFILANCVNMGLRIVHHIYYIYHKFRAKPNIPAPLAASVPSPYVLFIFLSSWLITSVSSQYMFSPDTAAADGGASIGVAIRSVLPIPQMLQRSLLLRRVAHVGVGVSCLIILAGTVLKCEHRFLQQLQQLRRGSFGGESRAGKSD